MWQVGHAMSNKCPRKVMTNNIKKLWLDESGDSGFKFALGSSQNFVITLVYLESDNFAEEVVKIRNKIDQLKEKFSLTIDYEFKFSRCKDTLKREFLKEILKFPIRYKAIVVNKKQLEAPALRYKSRELYCEMIRRLLYDNNPPLEKATLVIDEAAAKIHQKEFKGVLKKYLSRKMIGKIIQMRSRSEIMIQIADMVSGTIFRKYERGNDEFWQIVRKKEKILMEF